MYVLFYVKCMSYLCSVANIVSLCIYIVSVVLKLSFHMLFIYIYNCCRFKIRLILSVSMRKGAQSIDALMFRIHVRMISSIWFAAMHLEKVHCSYRRRHRIYISVLECISVHENNIVFYLNKTSKTCLKRWLKKGQKLAFNTDYRLMQVKSIAECSKRAYYNAFDLHLASICR